MADPCDDEDNFEEDGCTMDFFDDPDPPPGTMATTTAGPVTYRHYEGEDFAQYLNDDDEEDHQHTHHCSCAESGPSGGGGGIPADDRSHSRRRLSTANIREKLGRLLLTGGGSGRSRNSTLIPVQQNLNRICDVSFADCKMGNRDGFPSAEEGSVLGSDSGIDCRSGFSLETESDLGAQASSGWWDMDSLSSSKRQPRSSASAIDFPRSVADYSSSGSGRDQRRIDRPEARSGGPEARSGGGGETAARREPARKLSSDLERSDGANKSLTNTFRKFYNTLSRRKSTNLQQMSYDQNSEDIRL